VRREGPDHVLVLGEAHLRRVLGASVPYGNRDRPHHGLAQRAPGRPEAGPFRVVLWQREDYP